VFLPASATPQIIVVICGSARAGTPIMRDSAIAALDLPLRVLIGDDVGSLTLLYHHQLFPVLRRADLSESVVCRFRTAKRLLNPAIE
jgi:uncharacterized protein (DUF302 family)